MARVRRTRRRTKKISMETREQIKQLSLMNNAFMNLALEDNIPCVEEMLRVILSKPDLVVKTARTQKMFQGFRRSIYQKSSNRMKDPTHAVRVFTWEWWTFTA